jgi:hypothetical protein
VTHISRANWESLLIYPSYSSPVLRLG